MKNIRSLRYQDGILYLIDQRKLPNTLCEFPCETIEDVEFAIRDMVVRGAPAIGAVAAFGMVLAIKKNINLPTTQIEEKMVDWSEFLNAARPTAVNLTWATKQMKQVAKMNKWNSGKELFNIFERKAIQIMEDDIRINKKMGENGNHLIPQKATILTHCNTGALATVGWGTALGVVRSAVQAEKDIFIYADETRPRLQGARLTAWELVEEKIPHCLIPDSVAAVLIRDKKIDLILVGADRIARNGDIANKIGTFMISVIAKQYNVPLYVVAPTSTIDFQIGSGSEIIIEERAESEVKMIGDELITPHETKVYNPAFDVTPYQNITAIITEKDVIYPPYIDNIKMSSA